MVERKGKGEVVEEDNRKIKRQEGMKERKDRGTEKGRMERRMKNSLGKNKEKLGRMKERTLSCWWSNACKWKSS